jgi:predicted RNase H-like nuclease (RuvC/YqgF family)
MEVKMNQSNEEKINRLELELLQAGRLEHELNAIIDAKDEEIASLKSEVSDLEHERKDNDALLWKVSEQQKEIERLQAACGKYAVLLAAHGIILEGDK